MVSPSPLALRLSLPQFPIRVVLLALLLLPAALRAQATQTVPPDDPVYGFIDRLVAARMLDSALVGQRPMSRRAIAQTIAAARGRAGSAGGAGGAGSAGSVGGAGSAGGVGSAGWLATRLAEYATLYPDSIALAPTLGVLEADVVAMDSPARGIAPDANGMIDVRVNPLASNQLGRRLVNGGTYSVAAGASAGVTSWLAIGAKVRSTVSDERPGGVFTLGQPTASGVDGGRGARHDAALEQLYARALWRNVAVTVGRDYLYFGQGLTAGLTSSLNARALDQVRVGGDRPFVLPWWLRYAGPMQATVVLADLGADQPFPHARLLTYKLSARPHSRLEIGTTFAEQVGGEGSPGGTFLQKLGDAIPLIDATILHRNFLFSNKFTGADFRYAIPGVRGTQFYFEGLFDDFDLRRPRSVFTEDAAYVWGLSSSCIGECGPVRASVEYHVTGLRFYTHAIYRNGYTVDSMLMGDQLGPRGKGAYATVDLDRSRYALSWSAAYEARSGDKYGSVSTTPDDSDFRFVILEHYPTERRWRGMATVRRGGIAGAAAANSRAMNGGPVSGGRISSGRISSGRISGGRISGAMVEYRLSAGVERVENFGHVSGSWRTNWMVQAGVQLRTANFR